MPAQAGIHDFRDMPPNSVRSSGTNRTKARKSWLPAFAGMTVLPQMAHRPKTKPAAQWTAGL